MHIYADVFSAVRSLVNSVGSLAAFAALVAVGVLALAEIGRGKHGSAVVLVLVAIIPLWFLLDPNGASSAYKATAHHLH